MRKDSLRVVLVTLIALALGNLTFVFAQTNPPVSNTKATVLQEIRGYDEKRDFDALIKASNEYLISDPKNIEVLIRLARCYKDKKEYSLAGKTIMDALDIDPKNAWGLRILAKINREQYEGSKQEDLKKGYLEAALVAIARSLTSSPQDAVTNAEAAQIYFYKKDKVKAAQAIALALDSNNIYLKKEDLIKLDNKIQALP